MVIEKRTTLVLFLSLFCVMGSGDVRADDTAAAEATFQRGREHLAAGRLIEACNDFALSAKLEASTGTFLNLGECNQKLGKTASAWSSFMKALSHAKDRGQERRAEYAKKRAAALKPKLTHAEMRVNGELPSGTQVTRNGKNVTPVIGVPVPLDPGDYLFMVNAPGYEPWSNTVRVAGEGKTVVVQLPRFTKGTTVAPPVESTHTTQPSVAPAIDDTPVATNDSADGALIGQSDTGAEPVGPPSGKRRTLALRVGGAGLAVAAAGFVFGGLARSKLNESNDGCDSNNVCSQAAFDLREDGETFANVATVLVGVGALGMAAGAYFWFTPPKAQSQGSVSTISPVLMPERSGVGLAISGTY